MNYDLTKYWLMEEDLNPCGIEELDFSDVEKLYKEFPDFTLRPPYKNQNGDTKYAGSYEYSPEKYKRINHILGRN